MSGQNRGAVVLFDEDEEIDPGQPPRTTRTAQSAKRARSPSDKTILSGQTRVTQDDLFASTFAGYDDDNDEYKYLPTDEDEATTKKRRSRISGGRPPAAKPISADLDEADVELIRMKEAGDSLSSIAAMLKEKHDLKYEPKSVHSRYLRLKEALAAQKDQELALGLDTWHEGEDEALMAAYHKANEIIEEEYAKLKGRRFLYTAKALTELKPSVNYSALACGERYRALMAGTAAIPPELDDDPEQRADELAENKMKWIEAQDKKERDGLEANERARMTQSKSKQKWHEKLKGAADRDHDRVLAERERLVAQLEEKERKLANLEKRKVARAAKLERLATGSDAKSNKRLTFKEVEEKKSAALMRRVAGIDDWSASASPTPVQSRKRMRATGGAKAHQANNRKKGKNADVSDDEDDDYSMEEGGMFPGGASDDEYDPNPRKRSATMAIHGTRASTITDEAHDVI